MAEIRPYRHDDLDACGQVCILTGYAGTDARPHMVNPGVLPVTFFDPYVAFDPDLALVVDDGGQAVGYIVATADTRAFVEWSRSVWLPEVGDQYPYPGDLDGLDHLFAHLLHNPERMLLPFVEDYPAHLHIDMLPEYQRMGFGKALMEGLFQALRDRNADGVHLGMDPKNTDARAFYDRLRGHLLPGSDQNVTYLGWKL